MNNLLLEVVESVAYITFNRPIAYNALNSETLKELNEAIDSCIENEARFIVFTGVEKAFVAGADISEMAEMEREEALVYGELGAKLFRRIETLPLVTIAMINGFCLGGGNELAMACDLRIASNKAKFGQPEVSLGITAGFSGTQRLPRLVGLSKAKELLYTGKMIDAEEAYNIGLVNQVTDSETLKDVVVDMIKAMKKNSFHAIIATKNAIEEGIDTDIETAIKIENEHFSKCFDEHDQKEGMKAFMEKRKAKFN